MHKLNPPKSNPLYDSMFILLQTEDNVVDGEQVSIPLNVHNETRFVVELAGTSPNFPVMVGGLYVYACLEPEGTVTLIIAYCKNSKIWDSSNNRHNCPKNRKV